MTMGIAGFKTKSELKRAIGKRAPFIETSYFGPEAKLPGDNLVVGPDAFRDRRWFATVTVDADGVIVKVK